MKNKIIKWCDIIIQWCLYLLIFSLPFAKAGIEIFASLAIFVWIVKKIISHKTHIRAYIPNTKINTALGVFIIVNLISVIISTNFILSLRGFLGKVIEYVLLYFIVIDVITEKKRVNRLLMTITISAVLMILDSGAQYFGGYDFLRGYPLESGYYIKASFSSHNDFGGWLLIISPIFLCLFFAKEINNFSLRISLGIIGVLLFICLLGTYSRGAWMGFLVGLIFVFGFYLSNTVTPHKILIGLLTAICIVGIFFILPITMKERLFSVSDIQRGSGFSRINAWREALNIVSDYPLFGCGLNTYSIVAPRYKISAGGGIYPHNSFLHMAAEIGIIGFVSFFWIIVELFRLGIQFLRKKKDFLVLGLLTAIIAFLTHSFFDTLLYNLQLSVLFWFIIGLTISRITIESPEFQ